MTTANRIGALRRALVQLEKEAAALQSEVAQLEKSGSPGPALEALAKKTAEVAAARDELESIEAEREEETQATDELERLVDSFGETIGRVPELAEVLRAMKLTVGALVTAKRLQRADESLREPPQIAAALTQALTALAGWLTTPAGRVRLPDALEGTLQRTQRERFEGVEVVHRGRLGTANVEVSFD
jgi:chromosome segregation ATPase